MGKAFAIVWLVLLLAANLYPVVERQTSYGGDFYLWTGLYILWFLIMLVALILAPYPSRAFSRAWIYLAPLSLVTAIIWFPPHPRGIPYMLALNFFLAPITALVIGIASNHARKWE
jgi:hypothetical protein